MKRSESRGRDGADLADRIKGDSEIKETVLIMLTSGSQRGDANRFLEAGFAAYIVKPVVRPLHLLEAITRIWSRRSQKVSSFPSPPAAAPSITWRIACRNSWTSGKDFINMLISVVKN